MPTLTYRDNLTPPIEAIIELYRLAPLNRPIEDPPRIARSYATSNLVLSAWDGDRLAGVLRGWTDEARDGYICDLAIHPDYQQQGLGRELLRQAIDSNREVQFILRASPIARDYYKHIGWEFIDNGWFIPRER